MKSGSNEVGQKNNSLGAHAPNDALFIKRLNGLVYFLNNITHKISKLILFSLMILTTMDVIGRKFFNNPITGTNELTGLGLALIIFFSLGMTQLKGDHIAIDFLVNKFPEKIQALIQSLTSCVLFILLVLSAWQFIEYTKRLYHGNDVSGDLGIPMFIFTLVGGIGILFFALSLLLDTLQSLLKVVRKNES